MVRSVWLRSGGLGGARSGVEARGLAVIVWRGLVRCCQSGYGGRGAALWILLCLGPARCGPAVI